MAFSYPHQGACPFGLCLRPVGENSPAFASWNYHPPYLPPSIAIAVGNNSEILTEPMLFQIPFGQRPDRLPPEKAQPLDHPIGWREMTRLTLMSPVANQPLQSCKPWRPSLQFSCKPVQTTASSWGLTAKPRDDRLICDRHYRWF